MRRRALKTAVVVAFLLSLFASPAPFGPSRSEALFGFLSCPCEEGVVLNVNQMIEIIQWAQDIYVHLKLLPEIFTAGKNIIFDAIHGIGEGIGGGGGGGGG